MVDLSPQDLVDCSRPYGTQGCSGGWPSDAYKYAEDYGIMSWAAYPYHAIEQTCTRTGKTAARVQQAFAVKLNNEQEFTQSLVQQPVVVIVNASPFRFYTGGIFNDPTWDAQSTHAMLATGYGAENG